MIDIFKSKIVKEIPTTIYHYTSYDNFINILDSNEIWANSIKFQNDSEEFFEFIDLLSTEIKKSIEKLLKNNKISGEYEKNQDDFLTFSKNIFKHINKLLQDEKSEEKTSVFFDLIFEEPPTYEKILSNRPPLYPIFALGSKKEALDDLSFCTHSD